MIPSLSPREPRRKIRRALRRMTPRQRAIFYALRFEDASYPDLAERHGVTVPDVEADFKTVLLILAEVFDDGPRWWSRPWR